LKKTCVFKIWCIIQLCYRNLLTIRFAKLSYVERHANGKRIRNICERHRTGRRLPRKTRFALQCQVNPDKSAHANHWETTINRCWKVSKLLGSKPAVVAARLHEPAWNSRAAIIESFTANHIFDHITETNKSL